MEIFRCRLQSGLERAWDGLVEAGGRGGEPKRDRSEENAVCLCRLREPLQVLKDAISF